jgi:hypothetical protein
LTVDGKTLTAPLTVKMDPRIKTPALALRKKFDTETRLAQITSQTSRALQQGASIRAQLDTQKAQASAEAGDAIQSFEKKMTVLVGAAGGFLAPPSADITLSRANGEAGVLYQQVWQIDAEPTASQASAQAAVERDSANAMKRWSAFMASDVPALNRLLRDSKIPEIHPDPSPQPTEQSDEE